MKKKYTLTDTTLIKRSSLSQDLLRIQKMDESRKPWENTGKVNLHTVGKTGGVPSAAYLVWYSFILFDDYVRSFLSRMALTMLPSYNSYISKYAWIYTYRAKYTIYIYIAKSQCLFAKSGIDSTSWWWVAMFFVHISSGLGLVCGQH